MATTTKKETLGFQTEVKQLLHLMINALYSNQEIFLRELISNAADATDKLRFEALSDKALLEDDSELKVRLSVDEKKKTLSITDNGIGMSRDEVIANLGTIAKSGTREFLSSLTGDQAKDAKLIGQFGVGFYSSFIVADKVTVETRRAGLAADQGVRWQSDAGGEYTVEAIDKASRGTAITLHLKKDCKDFLNEFTLRNIVKKYSDHINLPVVMEVEREEPIDDEKDKEGNPKMKKVRKDETLNEAKALWTLPKSQIKDEEYKEFYKHISHDFTEPSAWSHNRVEGKLEYTTLLYLPSRAPFDLFEVERKHGLKLYIQRVFIMDDAEQFLPRYLRFIKGIVDCKDLPLNISREILQQSVVVDKVRSACIKRSLAMIEKMAKDESKYDEFWSQFGVVLKEGVIEDHDNKEKIAKLLRFSTTHDDQQEPHISLDSYIERMPAKQDKIYYITAESFAAAQHSPHLEIFRKKGIEVLLLSDRVDEWLVTHLQEYQGKSLQSIAKGELDLSQFNDEKKDEKQQKQTEEDFASIVKQMQEVLGERVSEVRLTDRLTTSPACIVVNQHDMTAQMQQILKQAGQELPANKPIFEINPHHRLIEKLKVLTDDEQFNEWTQVLFDEAILAEGGKLDDPASFVKRVNTLLTDLS